jgi:hypothetical protein
MTTVPAGKSRDREDPDDIDEMPVQPGYLYFGIGIERKFFPA